MGSSMIGRVEIEKEKPRPGESVRVEVLAPEDKPIEGTGAAVTINGVPGAVQFLQFPTAGQRRISVRAVGAAGSEREVVTIDVKGAPLAFTGINGKADVAMLGVTQSSSQPYVAVLTIGSSVDLRTPPVLSPSRTGVTFTDRLTANETVSRLTNAGALARAIADNAKTAVRIAPRGGHREGSAIEGISDRVARKLTTSAEVYDLGNVDLADIIDNAPTVHQKIYEWDFGDGVTMTTQSPSVQHDFFAAIDHADGLGSFHVKCTLVHEGITVMRTLTIQSAYALCKRTGTIVPHVTQETFARKRFSMIAGTFTVHNVEDLPIELDRLSITAHTSDGDGMALPEAFVALGRKITVPARSSAAISANIPFVTENPEVGELPYDATEFSVLYAGQCGTTPVRCSAVFDLPVSEWDAKPWVPQVDVPPLVREPWPWELVEGIWSDEIVNPIGGKFQPMLDSETGSVAVTLGSIADRIDTRAALSASQEVMSAVFAPMERRAMSNKQLVQPRSLTTRRAPSVGTRIERRDLRIQPGQAIATFGVGVQTLASELGPPAPGPISEGQICDPDNLTEDDLSQADEGQLVCQLTSEVREVLMPARWMNARKGDIILSPGGDGFIGGLMMNVHPPQWYSHCGIMTRNYDEITHSTASQDRLLDHKIGFVKDGTDGVDPKILKYMWPGAITQTVQASIEGEPFPDPEFADKTYSVSAFGKHTVGVTHNDRMIMIPPLVVKPDPMQETPAVRLALHGIATDARADGGRPRVPSKYHYSFFGYTDPTIGLNAPEGPDAGWAHGTRPSVCSSFIWLKAEARKAHLETDQATVTPTDLEQSNIDQGAVVRPTTLDGLYTYPAEERAAAADWLFNYVHNMAFDIAGWFGEGMTDAADDTANQVLNMFANGDADGKDSDEWETAIVADAVSPDNMLWWDGPLVGGLYGYTEPAIYREPRIESYTISKWKKVVSRGIVRGRVFADGGAPAQGAIVQAFEGKTTFTGPDGSYTLTDVPLGSYGLKASKVVDGMLQSVQQNIELSTADMTVDIHLQPPSDRFRVAQIFVDFWGRDEENAADDEIHDPGPEYFEMELGPDKLVNSTGRRYKWGHELRVEYIITVRLLVNNTIDVAVQGTLYEGTDEDNKDLDGQGGITYQVAVGATAASTLTITNTDEDDDDAGIFSVSVKNVRNDN